MMEMLEWCMLPTYQLLESFIRVLTPGAVPI